MAKNTYRDNDAQKDILASLGSAKKKAENPFDDEELSKYRQEREPKKKASEERYFDCKKSTRGLVYIMSNPSMPGMVKIGMTKRCSEARAFEMYTTGVPTPFKIELAIEVEYPDAVEKKLHEFFGFCRISEYREFFRVDPAEAIRLAIPVILNANVSVQPKDCVLDDAFIGVMCTHYCIKESDLYAIMSYVDMDAVDKAKSAWELENA